MSAVSEKTFFQTEAAGGLIMVVAAACALLIANSPWAPHYDSLLHVIFEVRLGTLALGKPLLLWINDGLMAVFFLLVGLEIKREIMDGELSSTSRLALPVAAAIGGMAAPAAIYAAFNWGDPVALRGWAIPSATDIAFSLAALALLGTRAPLSLKVFLTTVAIVDDIGAIVVIAIFYTQELSAPMLAAAGIGIAALVALNLTGVRRLAPYILVGVIVWVCVLKSGVHATLAGIVTAFAIPFRVGPAENSPGRALEHMLHPWVAFGILPLFALANAGVPLGSFGWSFFTEPIPAGVFFGLLLGKSVGIFGTTWLTVRLGLAALPAGARWSQVFGVAILCGIGFTMSLFIGSLAFSGELPELYDDVRVGVLCGSIVAAVAGYLVLRTAAPPERAQGSRMP